MGRLIDLTNQRFGKLTALHPTNKRSNGHVIWRCQCECGNECEISSNSLRSGKTKSCGCFKKEQNTKSGKKRAINLTGQKFGKLTAVYPTDKRIGSGIVWHCRCDCGNECEVLTSNLQSGNVKSCGCLRKEKMAERNKENATDLTNQKFGKLTALYPTNKRLDHCIVWHCRCDCGNELDVNSHSLRRGATQSCGCLNSIGEANIQQVLQENNIQFKAQKAFEDCINLESNRKLRYDFYLPDYNRLIEFDGEQHFGYTDSGWNTEENFKKVQQSDKIKNEYALSHNIDLIRIPYWERDNITLRMILGNKYLINNKYD